MSTCIINNRLYTPFKRTVYWQFYINLTAAKYSIFKNITSFIT